MEFHIHTHLQRLATLLVSAPHAFEVESGVFVVCQVAAPEVDLHGFGLQRDVTIGCRIEVLRSIVGFCPIDFSGTIDIRSKGKALCPSVIEEERV